MGMHRKVLDKECKECGSKLVDVSIKSPWIDDFEEGCDNDSCQNFGSMEEILLNREKSAYRRENAS